MELKDFISETLIQIEEGLKTAKSKMEDVKISPDIKGKDISKEGYSLEYNYRDIDFDIALTASDSIAGEAKAGLRVLGVEGSVNKENSKISRIKFSIPIGIKKFNR